MAILVLLLLLLAFPISILFVLSMQHLRPRRSSRRLPPGPKGLPFIGNIHQVDISKPHIWLTEKSKKYGPLTYYTLCGTPVVVISSADMAKKALKENDIAFSGRPYTLASLRMSYDHNDIITSPYSEYWRRMRKMVVHHLFSAPKLRSYRPIHKEEVSAMVAAISREANSNETIDIGDMFKSFNRDVLCRVAFGKKLDDGRRLDKFTNQLMQSLVETFLADCAVFGWINILTGAARRVERIFEEMDSFYQQLIDEHLDPNRPDSMRNDIVDLLIQLREDSSAAVKIDWKHVKAILMNIFVAGTDTTGTLLVWAMTALLKNPIAMKKVQEEIRCFMRNKNSIDEDDIEMLPYLKAVVKETLRLYPPLPFIPKQTTQACIINDFEIEKETIVFVNTWAINRDPEYWENPEEFEPERFMNSNIDFRGQELGFIPFGSGRRICTGIGLAVSTIHVALANVLYYFDWEIPNGKTKEDIDTDSSVGLVLHKKNALYLIPKIYI